MARERSFRSLHSEGLRNHWPAADGWLGTADDVVNGGLSARLRSSPNADGSYSYLVTTLGFQAGHDPWLPSRDTISFVTGRGLVDVDDPAVPLLHSLEFSGTELFPGHGAYLVTLTRPHDAKAVVRTGQVYTFDARFDFEVSLVAGLGRSTNAGAAGTVCLVEASQYGSPDLGAARPGLAAYVRDVVIPAAKAQGASAVLCAELALTMSGPEPGTPMLFPPLNSDAVIVAAEFAALSPVRITAIRRSGAGVELEWTEATGGTYSVEGAERLEGPFVPVVSGLKVPKALIPELPGVRTRFFRIRKAP